MITFKIHLNSIPGEFKKGSLLQSYWNLLDRSSLWTFDDVVDINNA